MDVDLDAVFDAVIIGVSVERVCVVPALLKVGQAVIVRIVPRAARAVRLDHARVEAVPPLPPVGHAIAVGVNFDRIEPLPDLPPVRPAVAVGVRVERIRAVDELPEIVKPVAVRIVRRAMYAVRLDNDRIEPVPGLPSVGQAVAVGVQIPGEGAKRRGLVHAKPRFLRNSNLQHTRAADTAPAAVISPYHTALERDMDDSDGKLRYKEA